MHVAIVSVDVGNVIVRPQGEPRQTLEVDFVANKGGATLLCPVGIPDAIR